MPQPYEILNARVKQKIDTEENWVAIEDDLGVILEGEQAFVKTADGVPVNFKIGDGTKKFSELPYFIAYYTNVISQKTLWYLDKNTDITINSVFRNYTCLYDLILINNSGADITLKAGTSSGANDLFEVIVGQGANQINVRKVFDAATTLYLSGLAGSDFSLIIVYFQYDENPAIPPSSSPTATFRWPRCAKGMYEPLTDGDLDLHWDFTTGRGKSGTAWENCAISGTNGTEAMDRFYPVGWQVGDSLRPATTFGNTTSSVSLTANNLPELRSNIAGYAGRKPGDGGGASIVWPYLDPSGYNTVPAGGGNVPQQVIAGKTVPDPIDLRPKSKVILFWVAIED